MLKSTRLVLVLSLLAFFPACGSSSFSAGSKSTKKDGAGSASGEKNSGEADDLTDGKDGNASDADGSPGDNNENVADGQARSSERYALSSRSGKIDMVWVIDNSGSMDNEAAQVKQNFSSFISSVAKETDIKVALLSSSTGGQGVTLPRIAGRSDIQKVVSVSSTNPLAIAAAATCAAATTTLTFQANAQAQQTVCSQSIVAEQPENNGTIFGFPIPNGFYNLIGGLESPRDVDAGKGSLSSFFRGDAIPIFVVVTDDDAIGVTEENFVNMVQPALQGQVPKLFAFRGASGATCDVTRPGAAYDALANQTGGGTFDICQPSWTPYFDALTDRVVEIASGAFVLPHAKVVKIETVLIDDEWVDPSEYKLEGSRLVLNASDRSGAQEVEVTYIYEVE